MIQIEPWLATLIVSALAALVAVLSLVDSKRKYRDLAITQQAVLNTKLDQVLENNKEQTRAINNLTCDMTARFKDQQTVNTDHEKRIVVVEESTKSAHKRIDELKGEI